VFSQKKTCLFSLLFVFLCRGRVVRRLLLFGVCCFVVRRICVRVCCCIGAQMPRRFSSSCPPPASSGVMWSTCVLCALLQTVQMGCSLSTTPLFFRYSGCLCCLLIVLAPLLRFGCLRLWLVVFHVRLDLLVFVLFSMLVMSAIRPSAITPRAFAS
jgi:hypothetical protein